MKSIIFNETDETLAHGNLSHMDFLGDPVAEPRLKKKKPQKKHGAMRASKKPNLNTKKTMKRFKKNRNA